MGETSPLADNVAPSLQEEMRFDLRLILGMLSSSQIRSIVIEAEQRGLSDVVTALRSYLSQHGRGRPRHDKYAEIDAWLIVFANELFRRGSAPSAWSAIARAVEGAWSVWDNGTPRGRQVQEVMVGNAIFRAPEGMLLSRHEVLGQSINAAKHRVLNRLRPNKRYPTAIQRDGRTIRFRLPDIYAHLPLYKALKPRRVSVHKPLVPSPKQASDFI